MLLVRAMRVPSNILDITEMLLISLKKLILCYLYQVLEQRMSNRNQDFQLM